MKTRDWLTSLAAGIGIMSLVGSQPNVMNPLFYLGTVSVILSIIFIIHDNLKETQRLLTFPWRPRQHRQWLPGHL